MRRKLLSLIFLLSLSCNAFAIPNPFIFEGDVLQSKKIANTTYYCVYTAAGATIANKTEAGYYEPVDSKDGIKQVKQKIKQFQKKYNKAKNKAQKAKFMKKIQSFKKAIVSINTCKKFNVKKLACDIFANKFSPAKVVNGTACTNQKKSAVAKIVIDYGTGKEADNDLCTGTLIYSNAILTAAHCFGKVTLSNTETKTIGKLIKEIRVTIAGKTYKATGWFANPNWSGTDRFADTAVVWLDQNINKTPFKLAKKSYAPSQGDFAAIIGFGVTKYKNKKTSVNGYAGGFVSLTDVGDKAIMTTYAKGSALPSSTTCFGDSGGPLVSWIDGAWRILGTAIGAAEGSELCGYYTGYQDAFYSRINSPENVQFLEDQIPGIFEE